jgi:hypothetical protein
LTARAFGANLGRMDLAAFRASFGLASPPDLSPALRALWLDARGDWDGAHEAAQVDEGGAVIGSTPICIARRATPATPPIGTAARASRSAELRSTRNGRRSQARFCRRKAGRRKSLVKALSAMSALLIG